MHNTNRPNKKQFYITPNKLIDPLYKKGFIYRKVFWNRSYTLLHHDLYEDAVGSKDCLGFRDG